jgi:hypothetical protein
MQKACGFSMHFTRLANLPIIALLFVDTVGFSQQAVSFAPTLQLEKPVFVVGESVRLWVGVLAETDVPESVRESGVMHVVGPDGSRIDDHVSWPRGGNPSRGWLTSRSR